MRVDGVVDHRPQNVGGEEADGRYDSTMTDRIDVERRTAQEDGPGEREAQHELRVVGDALHERVDHEEDVDGNGMPRAGGRKHHEEGDFGQDQGESQHVALHRRDGPSGNRSRLGASHLAVKLLVDVVVPAACHAPQDDAVHEEQAAQAEEASGRRDGLGQTGSVSQTDEVGDVIRVKAGRFLEPHQFRVGSP